MSGASASPLPGHPSIGFDLTVGGDPIGLDPPTAKRRGPPWMLTFIDLLSLLLTFFVMLFATSAIDRAKWDEVAQPAARLLNPGRPLPDVVGGIDYTVPRAAAKPALDLGYLAAILAQALEKDPVLARAIVRRLPDRLVLTLPSDLLFAPSDTALGESGRLAVSALSAVLKRLPNRVDVAGHTDPTPVRADPGRADMSRADMSRADAGRAGPITSNWELSLRRALAISSLLSTTGYGGAVTAIGYADTRFGDIDPALPLADRYRLARRVDIVIRDFAPE